METIGKIVNGNVIKDYYKKEGYIYKNFNEFNNKTKNICYIPEESGESNKLKDNTTYNYFDFLELSQESYNTNEHIKKEMDNNLYTVEEFAEALFLSCNWQHPETLLEAWEDSF